MTIPNYLALYNLSQIEADVLVVSDLTATTGTIYTLFSTNGTITTLNSTTGTITTLNSTTGNITNLNTNNIQANPVSSAVTLYTTHTGALTLGNSSNTNNITINSNVILGSAKKIISNSYQPRNSNDAVSLLTEASTGSLITLGGLLCSLTINPPITCNGSITLTSGNIIISSGNIQTNVIKSATPASPVSIYDNSSAQINFGNSTNGSFIVMNQAVYMNGEDILIVGTTNKITTPNITLSGTQTANKILLTDGSKNVVSSSYTDSDFARLAASNTFTGTTNTFLGDVKIGQFSPVIDKALYFKFHLPLDPTDGVYLSLYQTTGSTFICDTISSGDINIGNSASPITQTGSIFLYGNTAISSGKNLLCNTLTGTTTGSAISLFGTSTSLIDLGNSASTSVIRLNQNTSVANTKIFRTPYLYPTSTVADLYIGNQATDSGTLFIELNMDLYSSKRLKLNNLTSNRIVLSDASNNLISSAYSETTLPVSTPQQTALNLKSNINAPVFTTSIGLTSGDITITSGKLVNNTFQGTTAGSNINLFSLTTGQIRIGGVSSGIFLEDNILTSIGKTLTMTTSGSIINDTYTSIAVGNAISLFSTTTTGNLTCGTGLTSGSILLGRVGQTGVITCNTTLQANTLNGLATSSTITIGGALTNGLLILGNSSNTNEVRINNKFKMGTASGNAYWNLAVGSANNVFQSSTLSTFAMPPVSASTSPPLATWAVWETNAQGEGAFIAMNGDTTIICNPADNYAIHWQDEDFMTVATGFKFDASGVMTTTSDARAKTNINPYNKNNVLNKLNKIEMIKYTKKRPDGITRKSADDKYSKVHTGYTAQNLIEIGLDEFVEQPTTPDGFMSVCYGDIQFLFNAGVQELIKENRQQQKQIDDLTARLLKLELNNSM